MWLNRNSVAQTLAFLVYIFYPHHSNCRGLSEHLECIREQLRHVSFLASNRRQHWRNVDWTLLRKLSQLTDDVLCQVHFYPNIACHLICFTRFSKRSEQIRFSFLSNDQRCFVWRVQIKCLRGEVVLRDLSENHHTVKNRLITSLIHKAFKAGQKRLVLVFTSCTASKNTVCVPDNLLLSTKCI